MEPKENIQFENEIIDRESEVLDSFNNLDSLLEEENNIQISLKYDIDNPLESSIEIEDVESLEDILTEAGLIPKHNHFRSFEMNIKKLSYLSSIDHDMLCIILKDGILDFNRERYPNLSKEKINTSNASFSYYLRRECGLYNSKNSSCNDIDFKVEFNSHEGLLVEKFGSIKEVDLELRDIAENSYECTQNVLEKNCRKPLEDVDVQLLDWYSRILEKQLELVVV